MDAIEQRTAEPPRPAACPPAWREAGVATYYGLPPLKESPYHWKTALSFWAEAAGGGPQLLAALVQLAGNPEDRGLVRAGRYLALAGAVAAPALLVSELHTPRRWLNMLRVFRPTSTMSLANLSLTAFGLCSGMMALGQLQQDLGHARRGKWLCRVFVLPAALAGAMLCFYQGTELEETSVALWAGSHPLLAPLFAATGLSAGTAALTLAARGDRVPAPSRDRLNILAILVLAVQLTGAALVARAWRTHDFQALESPSRGPLHRLGVVGCGIVAPLALRLLPGADSRRQENRTMAAAATLAGSYLLYETVLEAGNSSAGSARDYLRATRAKKSLDRPATGGSRWPGALGLAVLFAAGAAALWRHRRNS